jgi:hypothetical protein
LRAQNQEGFTEACQSKDCGNADHPPVRRAEALDLCKADRIMYLPQSLGPRGFTHCEDYQSERQKGGHNRHPEHGPEIVGRPPHQADTEQRAEKGPDRIE